MRAIVRSIAPSGSALFGSAFIGLGLLLLLYAVGMYADLVPGSRVTVPRPPALDRARPTVVPPPPVAIVSPLSPVATLDAASAGLVAPDVTASGAGPSPLAADNDRSSDHALSAPSVAATSNEPLITERSLLDQAPELAAADRSAAPPQPVQTDPAVYAAPMPAADAAEWVPEHRIRPPAGVAKHLRIPAIDLKTDAVPGGVIANSKGDFEWETVPFVAAHYVDTALVGARGNAVISGHVVTVREGNVFRNLYKMDVGQTIEVETVAGTFTYVVEDLKLVPPEAVEVMAPTPDATLTLITCGGEFNPRTRQFSERLVVISKLGNWTARVGD